MKRMILLVLIILTVHTGKTTHPSQAQSSDSTAPYLYYFSRILNTFIIERADGTDGWVLGEGVMAQGHDVRNSLTFSPSGQWAAWTSVSEKNSRTTFAYVLSVDGKTRLPLRGVATRAQEVIWSPIADDLLFIYRYSKEPTSFSREIPFYIDIAVLDASTGKMRLELRSLDEQAVQWSPDGQHLVMYNDSMFTIYPLDGTARYVRGVQAGNTLTTLGGQLIYTDFSTHHLFLEDIASGEKTEIIPPVLNEIQYFQWSPDGQHGVAVFKDSPAFWLFRIAGLSFEQVSETITLSDSLRFDGSVSPFWSLDNQHLVYAVEETFYHYDLTEQTNTPIEGLPSPENKSYTLQLSPQYLYIQVSGMLYRYDLAKQKLVGTPLESYGENTLGIFADEQSVLVFSGCRGFVSPCLHHWETEETLPLTVSSFIYPISVNAYSNQVMVHPTEGWAIYGDFNLDADYFYYSVVHEDGQYLRQLTDSDSNGVVGWLPPQVDIDFIPERATPIQPAPIAQAYFLDEYTYGTQWHPNGNQFAVLAPESLSIWDRESGQMRHEWEVATCATIPIIATELYWSADGTQLAYAEPDCETASNTGSIYILDATTGEVLQTLETGTALTANAQGSWLVGYADGTVGQFGTTDTRSGVADPTEVMHTIAMSADETYLAIGTSSNLHIWQQDTLLKNFDLDYDLILSMGFTLDNQWLIVATINGLMRIELATLESYQMQVSYNSGQASLSPDGRWLAYLGQRIHIYDVSTWDEVAEWYGTGYALSWSPDGNYLVVTSGYGWQLWEIPVLGE